MEQMVRREIERQDALEADEAARDAARDENVTRAEARMRELREEYARKELERREAAAVAGGTDDDPARVANVPDWPTAADTVDVDDEDRPRRRPRRPRRRPGAAGGRDGGGGVGRGGRRGRRRGGGAGAETRAERGRPRERRGRRRIPRRIPRMDPSRTDGDDEDDGCYEVDPTRWAERVDESYSVSSVSSPNAPVSPVDAPPTSAIEEPASAEANPMARSRNGRNGQASERAATETFEGKNRAPPEREKWRRWRGR